LTQPTSAEVVPEQSNETAQPAALAAQQQAPGEADPVSSANVADQNRATPPAVTDQEMSTDAPVLNQPPLAEAEP
ncbi:putative DNA primase, partial [Pseudomonas amygdali pv. mori]